MKEDYKAIVIHVIHHSKNTAKVIKEEIKDMIKGHVVELTPGSWFVGGAKEAPEDVAQKQLEERYPGSAVAVIEKRINDLTTECRYIMDPDAEKNGRFLIYLCSSNPEDGFVPVFNDDVYYINLCYEVDPFAMERTFGLAARDIIEQSRRVSEVFNTGEDDRFNCSNYVLSPLVRNFQIGRHINEVYTENLPDTDPYFVRQIMFDVFNGYSRSADIIRSLLFQKYD